MGRILMLEAERTISNQRLAAAVEYLQQNYADNGITLVQVAEHVGVTPNYLGRLFLKYLNCTFTDELNRLRVEAAKRILVNQPCLIGEVAEQVGFASINYFFRIFRKYEKCTPTEYRVRGE